jgi:hypothetical protein
MTSMYDLFLNENIMTACESFFNGFLKDGGIEGCLTEDDRAMVGSQVDYIIGMIEKIWVNSATAEEGHTEIIDKLIGMCVVSKMNEARLCNLLSEKEK